MMQQAIFLDRDGTLNIEKGYLRHVDDLELIPGAAHAIKALNNAGILALLTTNQTGAARGFYPLSHIDDLHARLQQLLWEQAEARLDGIYSCPHLSKGIVETLAVECECRKPRLGMIQQAVTQFPDIDLKQSFMIGDKASDVEFARHAQCHAILVTTGYGQRVLDGKYQTLEHQPDWVFPSVVEAVAHIVTPDLLPLP